MESPKMWEWEWSMEMIFNLSEDPTKLQTIL